MFSSSRAASPSPAMSAATASRRSPSRMASAMYGSSSTINTRMRRCYERRISSAYRKPHTCWQHELALTGVVAYREPAPTTPRPIPMLLVAGLLVVAAIGAARGYQLLATSSSVAASPVDVPRSEPRGTRGEADRATPDGGMVPRGERRAALGQADGAVPDGTTVWHDQIPGVANLDPALLAALRQAATDAADDEIEFFVESGWRSPEYQEQLLHEAVLRYGSG